MIRSRYTGSAVAQFEYYCEDCDREGRAHRIIERPGEPTGRRSCWGPGIPTTVKVCNRCGETSRPWVSADIVGGGW